MLNPNKDSRPDIYDVMNHSIIKIKLKDELELLYNHSDEKEKLTIENQIKRLNIDEDIINKS